MPGQKYLQIDPSTGDRVVSSSSTQTTAGAADAGKIVALGANGVLDSTVINSTVTSTGAGSSGKVVALDSSGRIDSSALPVGIGADTKTMTASAAVSAGNLINIDSATGQIRPADNSNGRVAHGFVLSAISGGASGTVYFEGRNTAVSGLTAGTAYFLGTAGAVTATPPTATNTVWQQVGNATAATELDFERGQPIYQ